MEAGNSANLTTGVWQVTVNGQIYETNLPELTEWIAERSVLPTDKVRFGEKRWVQARLIPQLALLFTASPTVAATNFSTATVAATSGNIVTKISVSQPTTIKNLTSVQTTNVSLNVPANSGDDCTNHHGEAATMICRGCRGLFCKACPKTYGSVKICPLCGEMCEPFGETPHNAKRSGNNYNSGNTYRPADFGTADYGAVDFGLADFGRAWAYPFQFTLSLVFGAVFVAVLSFAGMYGYLLSNMILFGCIAQTINEISRGNLRKNFMPDFDDFSLWDGLLRPSLLSIGVSIVSWLPVVLVIALSTYLMIGTMATSARPPVSDESPQFSTNNSSQAADLSNTRAGNSQTMTNEELAATFQKGNSTEEAMTAKLNEIKADTRKPRDEMAYQMLMANLQSVGKNALPLLLLIFGAVFWGVFYSPMALAIAGFTGSFTATINPLVGLDTIRRMGGTYVKVFFMCFAVQLAGFAVTVAVGMITAPLDLPLLGNLPAKFITGITSFYFSLVLAFILGAALYKTADRLGIQSN